VAAASGGVDDHEPAVVEVEDEPSTPESPRAAPEDGLDAPPATGGASEDLFARLRASREEATARARSARPEPAPAAAGARPSQDHLDSDRAGGASEASGADREGATAGEVPPPAASDREARDEPTETPLTHRDEALAPLTDDLGRRARRALQDEQNELLDRLRRRRKRDRPEKLLAADADHTEAWVQVLGDPLSRAYAAGAGAVAANGGRDRPKLPARTVADAVGSLVGALRERVRAVVMEADPDPEALASRVNARYREWRTQELDTRVVDLLAATHALGAYDAAPAGARLAWRTPAGGSCADCDDNTLEPTVRGEPFPTGQLHPPAHPGCRCLIVLTDT